MLAKFLEDGDKRLDETYDFEVQMVNYDGEIVVIEWEEETTFNKVFDGLEKRYGSFDVSVLDYGDELQAMITLHRESVKHSFRVIMA